MEKSANATKQGPSLPPQQVTTKRHPQTQGEGSSGVLIYFTFYFVPDLNL
jgi:hypothetical protein